MERKVGYRGLSADCRTRGRQKQKQRLLIVGLQLSSESQGEDRLAERASVPIPAPLLFMVQF